MVGVFYNARCIFASLTPEREAKKIGKGGVREEGSGPEPPSPHSLAQGGEGGKECVLYL